MKFFVVILAVVAVALAEKERSKRGYLPISSVYGTPLGYSSLGYSGLGYASALGSYGYPYSSYVAPALTSSYVAPAVTSHYVAPVARTYVAPVTRTYVAPVAPAVVAPAPAVAIRRVVTAPAIDSIAAYDSHYDSW